MKNLVVTLDCVDAFDEIIDVRTPLEFADDHLPGAINAPVLSNEERVRVGTLYKQASAFEATRVGAALVAKNIATHLDTLFADRPQHWRPLIYCWRGGKRSGSMTTWFNLIGWRARQLQGGYKAYRRSVLDALEASPARFSFITLLGHTGSGKTRLLHALALRGAQVLDLEGLAAHRGSVLGAVPNSPQPSQKAFDTRLVAALASFDPARPVFVEAESRQIGVVSLPKALLTAMHGGACVKIAASRPARVTLLLQDYGHLFDDKLSFETQLARLTMLHGNETVARWKRMIAEDAREDLFGELIDRHYDPAYARSSHAHFSAIGDAPTFVFDPNAADLQEQAGALLATLAPTCRPAELACTR